MPAEKQLTMFQSACMKLRVSRGREIVMLVVDGQGAALVPTEEFVSVEQWAKSKTAAPNAMMSMNKMIERVETMVARPGTTFASTRGSTKALEVLVRRMNSAGYDLKEYQLPIEFTKGKPPEPPKPKAKAEAEPEAAPDKPAAEGTSEPEHTKPYIDFR